MFDGIEGRFRDALPRADYCTLRVVHERDESLSVRRGIVRPARLSDDAGAMLTVYDRGGIGYAATCDLSASGLARAADAALEWSRRTAGRAVMDYAAVPRVAHRGEYESAVRVGWQTLSLGAKLDLLRRESERLKADDRVIDWEAGLWRTESDTLLLTSDGGHIRQRFEFLVPTLSATANEGVDTQTRTLGGHACCRQGGLEVLEEVGFGDAAPRIAAQAVELLSAPDCPSGSMDLLLAPDQMILQLHESIGHPLELDRILGDERNYAGRSFVTPDMFGTYRYGSDLLNVAFDPTRPGELASYAFDDDGQAARRALLIENGILLRPLGGATSQLRAGLPGVANSRATSWNRPAIDRMANLNLEPGTSRFEDMVADVERGVYMEANCSWSIDDSRNKFQFGCEWARRIDNGSLGGVVRKPNYRGISATFWRNLRMVGDSSTVQVLGTPYCGKGEPNQVIRVGHAAPACLFTAVDVFGGA